MKGKSHIAGGNGRAIVKTSAGVNRDFHPGIVGGIAGMVGNQRVIASGLIIRGGKKRIVKGFGTYAGIAAQRIAIEIIERTNGGKRHLTAFRRSRIHIIKVIKVKSILRFAEYGESVAFFDFLGLGASANQCDKQKHYARNHLKAVSLSYCPLQTGRRFAE